jgi:hypothetical protein
MDAEGSELSILAGAQTTLQKFRPPILVEISAPLLKQAGSSASALASELTRLIAFARPKNERKNCAENWRSAASKDDWSSHQQLSGVQPFRLHRPRTFPPTPSESPQL